MLRKFKFYFLGLIPGVILVFFILNKKGASCSGYLPNSRVIAESLSKKFIYTPEFTAKMTEMKMDEKFLRDSIFTNGIIDFDRSNAQKKPCPQYLLYTPEKVSGYEVSFIKCEEEVTFLSIQRK